MGHCYFLNSPGDNKNIKRERHATLAFLEIDKQHEDPCCQGPLYSPFPVLKFLLADPGRGGGGDSNIKMPRCVYWVSENGSILNDTFGYKTYPYGRDPLYNSYPFSMLTLG